MIFLSFIVNIIILMERTSTTFRVHDEMNEEAEKIIEKSTRNTLQNGIEESKCERAKCIRKKNCFWCWEMRRISNKYTNTPVCVK